MKENDQLIKVIKYITKEKIIEYANASGDFNPIHIDKDFAKNSQFGHKRIEKLLDERNNDLSKEMFLLKT